MSAILYHIEQGAGFGQTPKRCEPEKPVIAIEGPKRFNIVGLVMLASPLCLTFWVWIGVWLWRTL